MLAKLEAYLGPKSEFWQLDYQRFKMIIDKIAISYQSNNKQNAVIIMGFFQI